MKDQAKFQGMYGEEGDKVKIFPRVPWYKMLLILMPVGSGLMILGSHGYYNMLPFQLTCTHRVSKNLPKQHNPLKHV